MNNVKDDEITHMRKLLLFVIVLAGASVLPSSLAARGGGGRVHYIGGTLAPISSHGNGSIDTTNEEVLIFHGKDNKLQIPYRQINVLEYGQKVNRRFAEAILISPLMLLSKKRKHFLTVGYTDQEGHQQAMVFQMEKSDVRSILASLEARTGRRIEFQDEEARKAGKG